MSMNDHMHAFDRIVANFLNLDENVENESQALLLLNSVLEVYEHLTTTLLYGKYKVTFNVVRSTLLSFEQRKKDQNDHRDMSPKAL